MEREGYGPEKWKRGVDIPTASNSFFLSFFLSLETKMDQYSFRQHYTRPSLPPISQRFESSPDNLWTRTSNSRDEIHPSALDIQLPPPPQPSVYSEPVIPQIQSTTTARRSTVQDSMPSASDFVKKLYKYVQFIFY